MEISGRDKFRSKSEDRYIFMALFPDLCLGPSASEASINPHCTSMFSDCCVHQNLLDVMEGTGARFDSWLWS